MAPMRYLFLVTGAIAIALVLCAVYHASNQAERPPIEVREPKRNIGDCPIGTTALVFEISNHSNQTANVVGVVDGCGINCCVRSKCREGITIPSGGVFSFSCEVEVRGPGPFQVTLPLFLSDGRLHELELSVCGIGVESGSNSHAQPER